MLNISSVLVIALNTFAKFVPNSCKGRISVKYNEPTYTNSNNALAVNEPFKKNIPPKGTISSIPHSMITTKEAYGGPILCDISFHIAFSSCIALVYF